MTSANTANSELKDGETEVVNRGSAHSVAEISFTLLNNEQWNLIIKIGIFDNVGRIWYGQFYSQERNFYVTFLSGIFIYTPSVLKFKGSINWLPFWKFSKCYKSVCLFSESLSSGCVGRKQYFWDCVAIRISLKIPSVSWNWNRWPAISFHSLKLSPFQYTVLNYYSRFEVYFSSKSRPLQTRRRR